MIAHPQRAKESETLPGIVCEFPVDIPEYNIKAGSWMVVSNLGEQDGAIISHHPGPLTAQALLTHPSAHVYALPVAPSPKRFLRLSKR